MKIRFRNTVDDYAQWLLHHYNHSPAMLKQKRGAMWGIAIAFGFFAALLALFDFVLSRSIGWVPIGLALLGIIWVFTYPSTWRRTIKKAAQRLYGEGSTRGMVGDHELEVLDDGIIERNYYGEQKTFWRGVDRVVIVDEFLFIYLSSLSAHVVPIATVEGDWKAFANAVREQLAMAPPSAPPSP